MGHELVARILGNGKRQRTRVFTGFQSHYLFEDRFGRPGRGNDKGKVEGLVGFARRNFLVPIPVFDSFEALNIHLLECCCRRMNDRLRGHDQTIGERLERDLAAFQTPLPPAYDACEKIGTTVSSLSLVRYRLNDYSVPTSYGHREVFVRGYVHEVVISCGAEIIARHSRSYEREDFVFDPLHYLALIERKINALDDARQDGADPHPPGAAWDEAHEGERRLDQFLTADETAASAVAAFRMLLVPALLLSWKSIARASCPAPSARLFLGSTNVQSNPRCPTVGKIT